MLSYIDLGLNHEVKLPLVTGLIVWMAAGAVTLGLGDNTGWGGGLSSNWSMPMPIPGATLTADGKTLIEKGALK